MVFDDPFRIINDRLRNCDEGNDLASKILFEGFYGSTVGGRINPAPMFGSLQS